MNQPDLRTLEGCRAEAAAAERDAILAIIERHLRHLAHGHGVSGAQALQGIVEDIRQRAASQAADRA
jgi:hypothetical protein